MISPAKWVSIHDRRGSSSAHVHEERGLIQFGINNFSKIRSLLKPGDAVTSQALVLRSKGVEKSEETRFCLQVFVNGVTSLHQNHVSVALANLSSSVKQCSFTISILNQSLEHPAANSEERHSITTANGTHTFAPLSVQGIGMTGKKCVVTQYEAFSEATDENERMCSTWCVPELAFTEDLVNNTDPTKIYCMNDTIKFVAEITVSGNVCVEEGVKIDLCNTTISKTIPSLSTDFGKLIADPALSDIRLVSGSTTVAAHKAVLSARSPVFRRKFSQQFFGARLAFQGGRLYLNEKFFLVHDSNTSVLREFVQFLYTDAIALETLAAHAKSILKLATKYEIKGLEQLAVEHLTLSLTPEEVAHILRFAISEPKSEILEKECTSYIYRHFSEVTTTQSFKDLDANLMKTILSHAREGEVDSGGGTGGVDGTDLEKLRSALEDVQHEGHESSSCHTNEG